MDFEAVKELRTNSVGKFFDFVVENFCNEDIFAGELPFKTEEYNKVSDSYDQKIKYIILSEKERNELISKLVEICREKKKRLDRDFDSRLNAIRYKQLQPIIDMCSDPDISYPVMMAICLGDVSQYNDEWFLCACKKLDTDRLRDGRYWHKAKSRGFLRYHELMGLIDSK